MKIIKVFTSTFIYTLLFVACQKEITGDDIIDPVNPPIVDSSYIDQVSYAISNNSTDSNFLYIKYNYDVQKRVRLMIFTYEERPGLYVYDSLQFFYNGTDTLAFKMIDYQLDTNQLYNDTVVHFLFYDQQKRKIKDSLVRYQSGLYEVVVTKFEYSNNRVFGKTSVYDIQNNFEDIYLDTAMVNANGDILENKKYSLVGNTTEFNAIATMTYDNNRSPLTTGGLYQAFWNFPYGETLLLQCSNKTNLLTLREESIGNSPFVFTTVYSYQYNALGLPKHAIFSFNQTNPNPNNVLNFTYRAL